MAVAQRLITFAIRQLADGAFAAVGLQGGGQAVAGFLVERLADQSQKVTRALHIANERAWTALEIALTGNSFWDRCKVLLSRGEDRAFREQLRAFLDANPLSTNNVELQGRCLQQLRAARKRNLLLGSVDLQQAARQAGALGRFTEPHALLQAEWQAIDQMADELVQAGYPDLGQLLSTRPTQGLPLLILAVKYFFRRQVEKDPELFRSLAFAKLEHLAGSQESAFAGLDAALTQQGQRLEALLQEVQAVVVQTHDAVLDLQEQIQGQSEQVRQISQAVQKLLEQHQLQRRELRPGDSLSIRNDSERELVKQLVARYRALPEGQRQQTPALLNAIGKLEVVAGDFDAAQKDFQAVALLEADSKGQAEAHFHAYLASLEKRDMQAALQELVKAVKLDGKRFALFPVGKYQPVRILGAGGFGVAFLCKHKYMDAHVVVKTLTLDDLGRDADKVFTEAQILRQLDHPSLIRISDCGYVDAARSRPFLVMDYFKGSTLEELVKKQGPLPVGDLLVLARQVAEALQAAHGQGVLHRDIKPANVLVRKEEDWKAKVIDFGLALRQKVVQVGGNTRPSRQSQTLVGSSMAGTADYAAPEQMGRREEPVGRYSDVYGWAKTCCFALFQTTVPLLSHWQSLPGPFAQLLERCLAEDPRKRPQDFAEVLAGLVALQATPPRKASTPRTAGRPREYEEEPLPLRPSRSERRKPHRSVLPLVLVLGGLGFTLAAMLATALIVVTLRSQGQPRSGTKEVSQPVAQGARATAEGAWVRLFNGKDLAGWKLGPGNFPAWKVDQGDLVASGPPGGGPAGSYLFTERDDYDNFHLRFELQINDGGNSGILFRVQYPDVVRGYEADVSNKLGHSKSGSVWKGGRPLQIAMDEMVRPDEWIPVEVIASGTHLTVKVNRKTTADFEDSEPYLRGHFVLQQGDSATVARFRNIEVKQLPR